MGEEVRKADYFFLFLPFFGFLVLFYSLHLFLVSLFFSCCLPPKSHYGMSARDI